MNAARLNLTAQGRVQVSGDLDFGSVNRLLGESARLFEGRRRLDIDLSGVVRSDSAGLALLVEWCKCAQLSGTALAFHDMPAQMLTIARVTGVDRVLNVS